jgi:hypothetical protein
MATLLLLLLLLLLLQCKYKDTRFHVPTATAPSHAFCRSLYARKYHHCVQHDQNHNHNAQLLNLDIAM